MDWYTGEVVLISSNLMVIGKTPIPERVNYEDFDKKSIIKIKRTQRRIFDEKMYGYLRLLKKDFFTNMFEEVPYFSEDNPKYVLEYMIERIKDEFEKADYFLDNPNPDSSLLKMLCKSANIFMYDTNGCFRDEKSEMKDIRHGDIFYESYYKREIYSFIQSPNSNFEFYELITPKIFYMAVIKYKYWLEEMLKKHKK